MRADIRSKPNFAETASEATHIPLIAHIIYRLDVGGLENGLVNLINRLPAEQFRHAIISLTGCSHFRHRIQRPGVPVYCLNKPPGNSPLIHLKLWRLLRELNPRIVHTRNLAALEAALPATLAGVPLRVHSEHGRDIEDLDGSSLKYTMWRRLFRPFVHQYIALSKDLERYLHRQIRVSPSRVTQLYNGVDTDLFHPATADREPLPCADFASSDSFVVGTVGRMQQVKDPLTLVRAFVLASGRIPAGGRPLRLVMVGDGALRQQAETILDEAGVRALAWLPGGRDDIADIMRGLDLFVLPSLNEGICNAVLEAMASGLPVVATAVGGNPELIDDGRSGQLVPPSDPEAMAQAILGHYGDAAERLRRGRNARLAAERRFSMGAMVSGYAAIYEGLLARRTGERKAESCAGS